MPATSLTPAMPAMAPLTSAAPSSVRETLMPAKRAPCGLRPAARSRRPAGVRASTYQATAMTTRASRKPRCSRDRSISAGNSAEAAIRGDSGKPVTGSRHGPWSRPLTSRSATGLRSRVVTTSSIPNRTRSSAGSERPRRAGQRAADDHQRQCEQRRQAADHGADAGRGDRAEQQLALRADVPVAGPEGDGHRGAGEQDRRGADEHLEQRELRGQRHDHEGDVRLDRVRAGEEDRARR